MYQDEHKYNVIKGLVPDFGYDVKFAIVVDEKPATDIPGRKNSDGTYYGVLADCGESTKAEWDYNAWNLKVDNIKSNSKCSLTFTSNLSEADYKKYIEAGVEYRRNTYRGKNITELWQSEKLYEQISNCTFDDIYVGDYIVSETKDAYNRPITWLIADLNNYLFKATSQCHATIIPAGPLTDAKMNTSDTTVGGYAGSDMVQNILGTEIKEGNDDTLNKYIYPDFTTHVIKYQNHLSNAMNPTSINRTGEIKINSDGSISGTGATSGSTWYYDRYLDLMSEVNVYGSTVWSSSGYDIEIDNHQYAIFQLKPNLINTNGNDVVFRQWLKAVATSTHFVCIYSNSEVSTCPAAQDYISIRPRFLID